MTAGAEKKHDDDEEDEPPEAHVEPVRQHDRRLLSAHGALTGLARCSGVAGERLGDAVDAREDGVVHPVLAHQRGDASADDVVRLEIGQVAADALAGLDADAALAGGDDQHNPVVLALLSRVPGLDELVAHVLDGLPLQRRGHQDEDLVSGLPLIVTDAVVEIGELRRAERAGGVGDVVGLLRDVERPGGTGDEEEQGRAERAPGPRWHQKVTLGACWASDEAWK